MPAVAREALPSFAPVLRQAEPAVVNIATVGRGEEEGESETLQDEFRHFFGETPRVRRSLGSGFIISSEGDIVSNSHVVKGAEKIRVRLATEEEFDARVVGIDDKTDIALLHVDAPHSLPSLPWGDSDTVEVGDWVLAIGNPFGLTHSATAGIVSAKGRFLGAGPYDDFIQTDASINPGNSGGPLIDLGGQVIAISAAIVSPAGGNVGIGFGVPANLARWVIGQLREHGRVVRGWIGIAIQPVTPELARSFGLSQTEGALVADVTPDSPAARAGIRRGDVIVRWNDRPVRHSRELPTLVAGTPPGTTVSATVLRDGKDRTMDVKVNEMPAERTATSGKSPERGEATSSDWGMAVRSLTPADAKRLGVKPGAGVLVVDVDEGSPADDAGLDSGDVIVQANRQGVGSPADLRRALAANPHRALLLVRRGTASIYVELER
jgi:serine protease Do